MLGQIRLSLYPCHEPFLSRDHDHEKKHAGRWQYEVCGKVMVMVILNNLNNCGVKTTSGRMAREKHSVSESGGWAQKLVVILPQESQPLVS